MPTTEETVALITTLSTHIATTLARLKRPSPASASPAPLQDIRSDLAHLFDEANKRITAAALACKHPVALDALHASLEHLDAPLGKIRFALEQLPAEGTLARKLAWSAQETLDALSHSLAATRVLLLSPPSSTRKAREAQLVATKGVWSAVERFARLPASEVEAERSAWGEVMGLLEDCAAEVRALAEGAGRDEPDDAEEDDHDDDNGETDDPPLTAQERNRALASYQLIRLARLLLSHLHARTSPPSPTLRAWTRAPFLPLAGAAAAKLSAAGDELAAVLEPGQDADEVDDAAGALGGAAEELARAMEGALGGELGEESAHGESAHGESAHGESAGERQAREKEREWLAMWRKQRDAARDKLAAI